jgi:phage portal protein BeeE
VSRLLDAFRPGVKSFSQPNFWDYPDPSAWSGITLWGGGSPDREKIENDFQGYVTGAYKASGVVFACIAARQYVFSEARFQYRRFTNGRPEPLFGDASLSLLEQPWPGGTTGELLARMEVDASLAGNFYATTADDAGRFGAASAGGAGRRIVCMRPDWVTLVIGSRSGDPYALDARVIAYEYAPPANSKTKGDPQKVLLLPSEVCHYSPLPDPTARFRGMSWLTPVIQEISSDLAATKHKLKFFQNGAVPGLVFSLPREVTKDQFDEFRTIVDGEHSGADNAYKSIYTLQGTDVTVAGADLRQLDFKATQGAGETRIAAAARVHPVVVGLSEGLAGSSLNAGNYSAARRSFADGTVRPLWRMAAASLQNLITPPDPGASLWFDDRDVAFLREDAKDQADIQAVQATALRALIDGGWNPDAAVAFVQTTDLAKLLGQHSGMLSVQLQTPGAVAPVQAPKA